MTKYIGKERVQVRPNTNCTCENMCSNVSECNRDDLRIPRHQAALNNQFFLVLAVKTSTPVSVILPVKVSQVGP